MVKKNVWTASLVDLVEHRATRYECQVVQKGTAHRQILEPAVEAVLKALCPWPAKKIQDWFWDTHGGRQVVRALWTLHSEDALSPSQAARLFWGKANKTQLHWISELMELEYLPYYFAPTQPTDKRYSHNIYVLRQDVRRLIENGDYDEVTPRRRKKVKGKKNEQQTG